MVSICATTTITDYRHEMSLLLGKTEPLNESTSELDLSIEVLSRDAYDLLTTIFPRPEEAPSLLV